VDERRILRGEADGGRVGAARGQGEMAHYPGLRGKLRAALALAKGDLAALADAAAHVEETGGVERFRKLTPGQVRALILDHRITLQALSRQAA